MGKNLATNDHLETLTATERIHFIQNIKYEFACLIITGTLNIEEDIVLVIDPWCEENLKGTFAIFYGNQWFELEEDAIMFTLRWG